MCDSILSM